MRRIKKRLLRNARRLRHLLRPAVEPKRFLHQNVPYSSQWESPELSEMILARKMQAEDDPKWKASGAATKKEYAAWSWSGCGMACTKMLLKYRTGKDWPLVTLGKKCATYGGYTMPLEDSIGLLYAPYATFMASEFGVRARSVSPLLWQDVVRELAKGNFVIASVNAHIRHPESTPKRRGGHLVLMLGYDLTEKVFYFHNPSGTSKATQEYASVSFKDFQKFFAEKGIVVYADSFGAA